MRPGICRSWPLLDEQEVVGLRVDITNATMLTSVRDLTVVAGIENPSHGPVSA